MKKRLFSLFVALLMFCTVLPAASAVTDAENGDWSAKRVTLRSTSEAQLMVRVGDIDNVGFGFESGYNPFSAENTSSHGFPWDPDPADPDGTDRIMMGSGYTGSGRDGYSGRWNSDPEGTTTRPIDMEFDASGITVSNAILQMYVDDFQAPYFGSKFSVSLNGKDAPFIAEVLNRVQQTGPIAYIISAQIPSGFFSDISSGSLSVYIDEINDVGDGYAVDFVKLLVNTNTSEYMGTLTGFVLDTDGTPISGATVRVLGSAGTTTTGADGSYKIDVSAGLNAVRASKTGYIENYQDATVIAGQTFELPPIILDEGQSTPDIDFTEFSGNAGESFDEGTRLTWIPVASLGYRLFRSKSRTQLGISVTDFYLTSTSYADVNVEPNTTYYYTVKPLLSEADPFVGMEEVLGDAIATYVVITGNKITNPESYKHFIILKLDNPYMSVDGLSEEIDPGKGTSPVIISGRTMIPIRATTEAIGGTVGWQDLTKKITLNARGNLVEMWVGKTDIIVNGVSGKMDVAPVIRNGRTFVPVRFAAENLNCTVSWINSTKEAVIVFEE